MTEENDMENPIEETVDREEVPNDHDPQKNIASAVYALQAASFLLAFTFLVAVVVNYVKRDEVSGTWVESHFRWQIRTFWFGVLWSVIGVLTLPFVVGVPILAVNTVWIIYRIVKGWLNLNDGKPMYM